MARTFSDSDFEPQKARTFTDADFHDNKPGSSLPDIITNEPAHGIMGSISRAAPAIAGGLAGAMAAAPYGAPFGPAGVLLAGAGGAVLGGSAMEATRNAVTQGVAGVTGGRFSTPSEVTGNVAREGLAQGAGYLAGEGIGAAGRAARPFINKLGAQAMRVVQAVPEKAGEMAMRNPSMLLEAKTPEAASAAYRDFEGRTGLQGLNAQIETTGKVPSEAELEKHLFEVAARTNNGVSSTPQELYHASQAANNLNQMAKLGNPRYAGLQGAIGRAKATVEQALESIHPEYKGLRTDYANAKAADEFNSLFPLNKNGSPNALRSVVAADTAVRGVFDGNPLSLAVLPLTSPMTSGALLKGAALAGKVPGAAYRVLPAAVGSELANAYINQRPANP